MASRSARILLALAAIAAAAPPLARAQCPATVPVEGAPPPGPLPLFPADNWWNADVSAAPVDPASASFIAFINNGGTRRLHPDFGGEASPGSTEIYGMPWVIVSSTQPKQTVTFQYASESDGVGVPYYPIPSQAITQPHWIEGGAPGNVDQRSSGDRHLLIIDCTNRYLYELYNVWYDGARWRAGSGAFFDMTRNDRRPAGWTSADAAGLAIFPGLVRYDEAWSSAVTDIRHAFRVTVRATNGHVFPASHTAGSTAGALPLGARLRLKKSVSGSDPALRSSDPNVQKIFRAMQRYGLIVADNGSDLFISGTFDTRWNNSILNPAFSLLTASDFEVVKLGWQPSTATTTTPPPPAPAPAVASVRVTPSSVVAGTGATGTVTLTAAAPSVGAAVSLSSASPAVAIPASVTVPAGTTSATFAITTSSVSVTVAATVSASYGGATASAILTVTPVPAPAPAATLASLTVSPATVKGGLPARGTVTLTAAAPSGGAVVSLSSSRPSIAAVPATVTIPAGASSATFTITTARPWGKSRVATISATRAGVTRSASLTVTRY